MVLNELLSNILCTYTHVLACMHHFITSVAVEVAVTYFVVIGFQVVKSFTI